MPVEQLQKNHKIFGEIKSIIKLMCFYKYIHENKLHKTAFTCRLQPAQEYGLEKLR